MSSTSAASDMTSRYIADLLNFEPNPQIGLVIDWTSDEVFENIDLEIVITSLAHDASTSTVTRDALTAQICARALTLTKPTRMDIIGLIETAVRKRMCMTTTLLCQELAMLYVDVNGQFDDHSEFLSLCLVAISIIDAHAEEPFVESNSLLQMVLAALPLIDESEYANDSPRSALASKEFGKVLASAIYHGDFVMLGAVLAKSSQFHVTPNTIEPAIRSDDDGAIYRNLLIKRWHHSYRYVEESFK